MRGRDDAGAATVELLALTLVLVIPLIYLVIAVGRVQAATYATEAAAYAASRAAVVAGLDAREQGVARDAAYAAGHEHAHAAVQMTLEDFGIEDPTTVTLACEGECLEPGTTVSATVAVKVALPGVPSLVRAWIPLAVPVDASGFAPVDGLMP